MDAMFTCHLGSDPMGHDVSTSPTICPMGRYRSQGPQVCYDSCSAGPCFVLPEPRRPIHELPLHCRVLCEQQRAQDLEEGGGGRTCEVSATSAGARLSTQPGLDRAETHERLLWLAGRFPFSLHEAVPESQGVPAALAGLRIPSARPRLRIQNLQSQCASLRGSELLVGRERDVFF